MMRRLFVPRIPQLVPLMIASVVWASAPGAYVTLPTGVPGGKDPDVAAGYQAYEAKDFAKALSYFQRAASADKEAGMFALGLMAQQGSVGKRDLLQAQTWYERAAAKGFTPAMLNLALLLIDEAGGYERGMEWLRKAADKEEPLAMLRLGQQFLKGVPSSGVEPDVRQARVWLERALNGGNVEAALHLGLAWETDDKKAGFTDTKKSMELITRAAEGGVAEAMLVLSERLFAGVNVEKNEAKGREWLQKAADQQSGAAYFLLGQLYERGVGGVTKDLPKAMGFFQKSLEVPEASRQLLALNKIAYFHEQGWATPKSDAKALEWYQKGADKGLPVSKMNAAIMIEGGRGTEKDPARALKLLIEAGRDGLPQAQYELGTRYRAGRTVAADPVAALGWFDRASRQGYALAQLALGEMLQKGEAGQPDPATAAQVYKQATTQGVVEAKARLAAMLEGGQGIEADLAVAYALNVNVSQLDPGDKPESIAMRDAAKAKAAILKSKLNAEQLRRAESLLAASETKGADAPKNDKLK